MKGKNNLFMRGQLVKKGEKAFIKFNTNSRSHYLPIESDGGFADGSWVRLDGILETKSFVKDDGKYGKIWVASGEIISSSYGSFVNTFTASGVVVKVFPLRITQLTERKIVDFVVACGDNYYNCIAFGYLAEELIAKKRVGSKIEIKIATFQSREYEKNGETRVAYEVVVRRFD